MTEQMVTGGLLGLWLGLVVGLCLGALLSAPYARAAKADARRILRNAERERDAMLKNAEGAAIGLITATKHAVERLGG